MGKKTHHRTQQVVRSFKRRASVDRYDLLQPLGDDQLIPYLPNQVQLKRLPPDLQRLQLGPSLRESDELPAPGKRIRLDRNRKLGEESRVVSSVVVDLAVDSHLGGERMWMDFGLLERSSSVVRVHLSPTLFLSRQSASFHSGHAGRSTYGKERLHADLLPSTFLVLLGQVVHRPHQSFADALAECDERQAALLGQGEEGFRRGEKS